MEPRRHRERRSQASDHSRLAGRQFVNVTTVRVLRPVLTAENHLVVLAEARHRSRKEVEIIAARINPKPDVPSTVRKLPVPRVADTAGDRAPVTPSTAITPGPVVTAQTTPQQRPTIAPLAPERYKVQFTVSKDTHDKLRRVQELLCREVPNGDPAAIFDRALDLLLRAVAKKKTAAFVGRTGRCTQRRYIEAHHIQPYGHQGPPTLENIALRCRAHNVYESELVFGRFDVSAAARQRQNRAVSGPNPPVPERVTALPPWARSEPRM